MGASLKIVDTEVEPGSKTVVAIGPAPVPEIDAITGALKLLR